MTRILLIAAFVLFLPACGSASLECITLDSADVTGVSDHLARQIVSHNEALKC